MTFLCQCGCGQAVGVWASDRPDRGRVKGQPKRFVLGHNQRNHDEGAYLKVYRPTYPRAANASGTVREHILIAERAFGKSLPLGAEVHHVDGRKRHNVNANLVICQDHRFHMLLHARTKVVRASGDPNTEKLCSKCRQCKPFSAFHVIRTRNGILASACRECKNARLRIGRAA